MVNPSVFTTEGFSEVAIESWTELVGFEPTTTELPTLYSYSYFFVRCLHFISVIASSSVATFALSEISHR